MRPRRSSLFCHLERDTLLLHTICFLFSKHTPPDKITFVERDKEPNPRFNRRGLLVQFVTVKRIANFRSQRVSSSEAAWFDSKCRAFHQQHFPKLLYRVV